jgi:undecaprenyl-diphosphatase
MGTGVSQILTALTHWPPLVIYLVAALVVGAETATVLGLVLPGEATLLLVGFLCYGSTLRLAVALPLMIMAGLAGDSLGYAEGRRSGVRLRTSRLGRWVGEHRWRRTDRLLDRHGGRAVFLARFVAFARTLAPRLVGMSGMSYQRFLPWNALGVAGCVGGTVLVGYGAGRSYATVAQVFGQATGAVLLLLLVIAALVVIGRYLGRHPDPVAAMGNRLAGWRPLRFLGDAYRAGFGWLTQRLGVGGAVAVNVLGGVLALFAVGYALAWVIDRLIRQSGLPLVDPLIVRWVGSRRSPVTVDAAHAILSGLRGSFLVVLVGVVALVLNWRSRVWRADLVGVLGTVGAFVPLVLIALATDWERASGAMPTNALFRNQTAVVTASLGMLAWLVSRRFGWAAAVAGWTAAVGIVVVVGTARVYVGWSWPSETVASALLGGLWVLIFIIAWHTRDRLRSGDPDTDPDGDPDTQPQQDVTGQPAPVHSR